MAEHEVKPAPLPDADDEADYDDEATTLYEVSPDAMAYLKGVDLVPYRRAIDRLEKRIKELEGAHTLCPFAECYRQGFNIKRGG